MLFGRVKCMRSMMFSISGQVMLFILVLSLNAWSVSCQFVTDGVEDSTISSCTNDTSGLPQCGWHYEHKQHVCSFSPRNRLPNTEELIWKFGVLGQSLVETESGLEIKNSPLSKREGYIMYKYVDTSDENIPVGSTTQIVGDVLDPEVKAVCITFWYATNSDGGEPPAIHVKNRKSNLYDNPNSETVGFIGSVRNNTQGEWRQAYFHACIWTESEIIMEAEKTSNDSGVAAIRDITVTQSALVCTCLRRYGGMPACHFNKGWCASYINDTSSGNLTWVRGTKLEPQMDGYFTINRDMPLRDGRPPGYFAFLNIGDTNIENGTTSLLLGKVLSGEVLNVCIIFHYATTGTQPQTLRIYNMVETEYHTTKQLLGHLTDKTEGKWKEASFNSQIMSSVADQGSEIFSYIAFEVEKIDDYSYFALDNMRISERKTYILTTTTEMTSSTKHATSFTATTDAATNPAEYTTIAPSTTLSGTTTTASTRPLSCLEIISLLQRCPSGRPFICCVDIKPINTTLSDYNSSWTLTTLDDGSSELDFVVSSTSQIQGVQPSILFGGTSSDDDVTLSLEYRVWPHTILMVVAHTKDQKEDDYYNNVIITVVGDDGDEDDDNEDGGVADGNTERLMRWKHFSGNLGNASNLEKVEFEAYHFSSDENVTLCNICVRIRNVTIRHQGLTTYVLIVEGEG